MHTIVRPVIGVSVFLLSLAAGAQQVTRQELGLGIYTQTASQFGGTPYAYKSALGSPQLRYDLNLNRSVALEASVSDSVNMQPSSARDGGHDILGLGGIKAGVRRRYFGIYGKLEAGASSFSRGDAIYTSQSSVHYYRDTHFTLQPGIALEAYLGKRTVLRYDIDDDIQASFRKIDVQTPRLEAYIPGHVPHHLGLALGIEHRFGAIQTREDTRESTPRAGPFGIGALFPLQIREHLLFNDVRVLGGGGLWVGMPLYRFLSADLVAFDLPHDDHTASTQDGGTSFSAFVGPKVGFHLGRFGLFAKVRPGITRFSRTEDGIFLSKKVLSLVDRPKIDFTLDTGGVVEYTASRHAVLRFEAGDAFTHYHGEKVFTSVQSTGLFQTTYFNYPPVHNASILFLTGVGWRF